MRNAQSGTAAMPVGAIAHVDVVIVGAGFAGLQALYRLREHGLSVRLLEAGDGVGGTWFWNRYPGARVDFESFEYSFSFSSELEQDWCWSERFPAQPELQRYLEHVCARFDLARDIQLEARVQEAIFDAESCRWRLCTENDETISCSFCVMATGLLSAPREPEFPGLEEFRGARYLTAPWPKESVDFSGLRVGVIGTGSSGVQVIGALAREVEELFVFQRTAPFVVPAHNRPMDSAYERAIKAQYATLRRHEFLSETGIGLLDGAVEALPLPRHVSALAVDATTRQAEFERRWQNGSLCFLNAFNDLIFDLGANETLAEFLREKIRAQIDDPALAQKLLPQGYPVFSRRLSVSDDYYASFNRGNVTLVDLNETPLTRFTRGGLTVGKREIALDAVIFATGFDAQTGALTRIDIQGRDGCELRSSWQQGPDNFLGLMTPGFPNLFYLCGPGSPTAFYPPILLAEYQTDWLLKIFDAMKARGKRTIEPRTAAAQRWLHHSREMANATVFPRGHSWYMGTNVAGKPVGLLSYIGGFTQYRSWMEETIAGGLTDFEVD